MELATFVKSPLLLLYICICRTVGEKKKLILLLPEQLLYILVYKDFGAASDVFNCTCWNMCTHNIWLLYVPYDLYAYCRGVVERTGQKNTIDHLGHMTRVLQLSFSSLSLQRFGVHYTVLYTGTPTVPRTTIPRTPIPRTTIPRTTLPRSDNP
jgi:hypothetical protein